MLTKEMVLKKIPLIANLIVCSSIILILLTVFIYEHVLHEMPCPLCLMQRLGFLLAGGSILLNLRYGENFSHYTLILLSMIFTCSVALRQISLHIVPGTGSFGSSFLGFHLYTWSFLGALSLLFFTIISLGFETKYQIGQKYYQERRRKKGYKWLNRIIKFMFFMIFVLAALNLFDTLKICGLFSCPENP